MDTVNFTALIRDFWAAVAAQQRDALCAFFAPDAKILWHCTNECFSVEDYLTANCEYPGAWRGQVERVEPLAQGQAVSVARVWLADGSAAFHAVSFFTLCEGRIARLEEYWGDDGPAPAWRQEMQLGTPIE